jgi:hypothetical protein
MNTRKQLLQAGWLAGPALDMAIRIEADDVACQFMVSYDNLGHAAQHALGIGFDAFRDGVLACLVADK